MESKTENESSSRSSTSHLPERPLRLGRVGRPHGNRGAFHVSDATERLDLLDLGRSFRIGSATFSVVWRGGTGARPLIMVDGIADRESARALNGEPITVARGEIGQLAEREYLVDDLISCEVKADGRSLGRVRDVLLLPSVEAIEVVDAAGLTRLVPLVSDAIEQVDLEHRTIEVNITFLAAET